MEKRHIFVVTGRQLVEGVARGAIRTVVACAENERAVHLLLGERLPALAITTVTSLAALEERAKRVRNALAGAEAEWLVLVDPALTQQAA